MSLATTFQEIIDAQAPDWSDIRFELTLVDELRLDEARLAMAPTQFERVAGERTRFTFLVSRTRGYGCHVDLAHACLERLDDRMMAGTLDVTRVLNRVDRNYTQGPVVS